MRDRSFWIFNAGDVFAGNPKWMFLFIREHHPSVRLVWMCYNESTQNYVSSLGFDAALYSSMYGKRCMSEAGVYVVEQCKEVFQAELDGIVVLNLWHGVGCKAIEKYCASGFLEERVVKKNIINAEIYANNQLFLVTSPFMEKHFTKQLGLTEDQLIRAGYPSVFHSDINFSSFDRMALFDKKRTSADTRFIVYSPTYRDMNEDNFFSLAIPDMDSLERVLMEINAVMIFKMHPRMESDYGYLAAKELYSSSPQFLFWDNANDFYEVAHFIDLAIVDYSSIFYDLLGFGVNGFIRYFFDINDGQVREFEFDVTELTCGPICSSFPELLDVLRAYRFDEDHDALEKKRLFDLFWSYSKDGTTEDIYDAACSFTPKAITLPILHSFDVFDTVIARSCVEPSAVFTAVRERMMRTPDAEFPYWVTNHYVAIRQGCEANVRQYMDRTREVRHSEEREISFDMIFQRMKDLCELTNSQIELLKSWELETEYAASAPITPVVSQVEKLIDANEAVVFISDMYLPEDFIKKLILKSSRKLKSVPLFVSSTYGVQKTTKKLYFKVFHSIDYRYGKWVHYGDNRVADYARPKALGIEAHIVDKPSFNAYERRLASFVNSYLGYQVAGILMRKRQSGLAESIECSVDTNYSFAYRWVSLLFTPYVFWVLQNARKNKYDTLYFISRDGHYLKIVADAIIETLNLEIKTKYIYGSRRAWRLPSFIDEIDEDYFLSHGNFADVRTFDMLLEAAELTETEFIEMFPSLGKLCDKDELSKGDITQAVGCFKNSEAFRQHVLDVAAKKRPLIQEYLKQEIDFNEKFAFVEYWGRGYSQIPLQRLMESIGYEDPNVMYYLRSIYPSDAHCIRYNFTYSTVSPTFVEAIFANLPYRTIEAYQYHDGYVRPVIENNPYCDHDLHEAVELGIHDFAVDFAANVDFTQGDQNFRKLYDAAVREFQKHKKSEFFAAHMGGLVDNVGTYSEPREYAPPITMHSLFQKLARNESVKTSSRDMTLARSSAPMRILYSIYRKRVSKKGAFYRLFKRRRR